jgi:transposase
MTTAGCQQDFVHSVMGNPSSYIGARRWVFAENCWKQAPALSTALDATQIVYIMRLTDMPRPRPAPEDPKIAALRAAGALHPHPERVTDELFARGPFFDRRDRVQVKYEMLRAHTVEGRQVSKVARVFGTSRQAFYAAAAAFRAEGLSGLLPRPRGPKRAHKCTDEILDFVVQWQAEAPPEAASVTEEIRRRFGVRIHPRSLHRALARRAKKARRNGAGRA